MYRESHHTVEQALEYDETLKEQLEKERETFVTKVTIITASTCGDDVIIIEVCVVISSCCIGSPGGM